MNKSLHQGIIGWKDIYSMMKAHKQFLGLKSCHFALKK